jgi:phosphomannomutase
MKNKFIFDVDGTLTPSQGIIDKDFEQWFTEFCISNDVYIVSGSDYTKTQKQLGNNILSRVIYVFSCSGNEVWSNGKRIEYNEWKLPEDARKWLTDKLSESSFPFRTGTHIEERTGTVNFSIIGQGTTLKERMMYIEWDRSTDERNKIALEFNHYFKDIEARVGGELGLDIYPRSKDKSQILKYFNSDDKLFFFGDCCTAGGNDYPLAKKIKNSFQVKNWRDTWERLEYLSEVGFAL